METRSSSVSKLIMALAAGHGITADLDRFDNMSNTFSGLSGDDVKLDEFEILLVHLARKEIISEEELFSLFEKYLDELESG